MADGYGYWGIMRTNAKNDRFPIRLVDETTKSLPTIVHSRLVHTYNNAQL